MFGLVRKKDVIAELMLALKDEYMTQRIGIGKLEKSAAIGGARFGARILTGYLGVSPIAISELRTKSQEIAGQNLISYSNREL